METSQSLLRQLKVKVNSETHTTNEWKSILRQIQEIGDRITMRLQLTKGTFLETVETEKKDEKE